MSPVKRAETPDKEPSSAVFAQKRELDELRIKVRLLEGRRAEDQDRIKSMEARAAEADTLRAARVKLQGMTIFHRVER
jgi:dynactin 1